MGLASKLAAGGAAAGAAPGGFGGPPAGAPGGYPGAPPAGQAGGFGAPPPAGQQAYPGQQGPPGGQAPPRPGYAPPPGSAPQQPQPYGAPPQGQFGQQQPPQGQFGQAQQPGQFGQPPPQQQFGQPQQQQAAAPAAGYGGAPIGGGGVGTVLNQKLAKMVQINRLEAFYPPQTLQQVQQRLDRVDFRSLAQRWNMPLELATDLATLALYDIVIFADDSGSMVFEENGERINDLKVILGRVAEVATLFDEDGIVIRFMNSNTEGNGIRDTVSAANLVQQVQFNGLTPLGTQLDAKVIRPFLVPGVQGRNLQKPILIIVITDGEPTGEPPGTVANVIKNAKNLVGNSQYGPGAVAFEFAQVGKDQKAQQFLGTLDRDPEIGKMVDATSYYELEADEYARKGVTLTPELWLVKLMVGAIDPTYDEQD